MESFNIVVFFLVFLIGSVKNFNDLKKTRVIMVDL